MTRSLRVAKNVSTTLLTQALSWMLAMAVVFYLPRYAPAAGYGAITLAGSFAGVFGLFSSLGISTVIMRDIPRDVSRAGSLVAGSLIARLPLAVLSAIIGLLVGAVMGYSHTLLLFIGISLFGTIIGVFSDTVNAAVRGLQTFSIANVGSLIDKFVGAAITILVCIFKGPLWMVVAASVVSSSLSVIYMFRGLNRSDIQWRIPDKSELIALARSGIPFLSAGVFAAIYAKSDAIFLSKMSTLAAVGWYGLAVRLSGAAMALPTTLCSAMLPPLSALFKESLELFAEGAARLLNLMVICCVPISAAMICCSGPLVGLFSNHAASYRPAAPVVQVYGVAIILYFISQGAAAAVIACDQEKVFGKAMAYAAFFSVPLTALCIYLTEKGMHNGAVGAALSDLLAELYLVVCYLKRLPEGSVSMSLVSTAFRATLAALPLMAEFYLVPSRYVLYCAAPCLALYAYLCFALGCLHHKDVDLIGTLVRGRLRRTTA